MTSIIYSIVPHGYSGQLVQIEGDLSNGLPAFNLVGLASKTIIESRDRVRSAMRSADFRFPDKRLTVNLAPAEIAKDGPHLDLPIALTVLILSGQLRQADIPKNAIFIGELSFDGTLRPVRGAICLAEAAKSQGFKTIFLPIDNYAQAHLIEGINLIPVRSLSELFLHLKHQTPIIADKPPLNKLPSAVTQNDNSITLDDVHGQINGKRAIQIAIAGHHNLLFTGPPGTGKTMLARAAVSLLPSLTVSEQIELTKLYSLHDPTHELVTTRPFRSPHHTSSNTAILGGGHYISPGEISLAHLGILFLDELPEFHRDVLEALRQPLEERQISLSRARYKVTYPANFMLIATMNPCPCGYLGDPKHACTCSTSDINRYHRKLSGPLLDRIDLVTEICRVDPSSLLTESQETSTQSVVKNTITEAIQLQHRRYRQISPSMQNGPLPTQHIINYIHLDDSARALLDRAASSLSLSARCYFKTIKVARTIADLESAPVVLPSHISEALTFRLKPLFTSCVPQ